MRILDRWVGVPVSLVLTLFRRAGDILSHVPDNKPRRIVIIKLVEQGATVVAAPAIERAAEIVGRENVFFAVFAQNRPILDLLGIIPSENVVEIRENSLITVALDTLRAVVTLRRASVDTAVDFEFFSRFSAALAYLSGARRRIGFHSFAGEAGYRGDLMTHRVAYNIRLHACQTYRMLVDAATVDASQLPTLDFVPPETLEGPVFKPDSSDVASVCSMLSRHFGRNVPPRLVLLNANAGDLLPIRRWADDRYVELAKRLLDYDPEIHIVLTGGPGEQASIGVLAAEVASKRCISVAGETTLTELFTLYSLSEVMVTNDSGPAHYASTTTIDVITLFGPESPAFFGAQSQRSHFMWAGLACSPCVNAFNQRVTRCTDNRCMQAISVDAVFEKVKSVLAQRDTDLDRIKPVADVA